MLVSEIEVAAVVRAFARFRVSPTLPLPFYLCTINENSGARGAPIGLCTRNAESMVSRAIHGRPVASKCLSLRRQFEYSAKASLLKVVVGGQRFRKSALGHRGE